MDTQATRWIDFLLSNAAKPHFEICGYSTVPHNWRFDRRTVPEHLLYLLTRQSVTYDLQDGARQLRSGELLWLAPETPHSFSTDANKPCTLFHVRVSFKGNEPSPPQQILHINDAQHLNSHFERLLQEERTSRPFQTEQRRATLVLLFTDILRIAEQNKASTPQLSELQRSRIYQLTSEHISERLTPADLADVIELSADYFTRVFKATFGMPPRRWLMQQRIQHAATRLRESTSTVSEIAEQLGYCDVYLFSRQFKAVMGVSPKGYQQRGAKAVRTKA